MKVKTFFIIILIGLTYSLLGQNSTDNSITIDGNILYFRPSTTASSPLPTIEDADFIEEGSWYGEDAARAWALLLDWAIENSTRVDPPIYAAGNARVYITQIHAYRRGSSGANRFVDPNGTYFNIYNAQAAIIIYYWVVPSGSSMENGRRETRAFWFM